MGDSGFDSVLGCFQVTYSYSPHSVTLDSIQPLTDMSPKEFLWNYPEVNSLAGAWRRQICRPICAECQSRDASHPPLSLYDLLGKGFFYSTPVDEILDYVIEDVAFLVESYLSTYHVLLHSLQLNAADTHQRIWHARTLEISRIWITLKLTIKHRVVSPHN